MQLRRGAPLVYLRTVINYVTVSTTATLTPVSTDTPRKTLEKLEECSRANLFEFCVSQFDVSFRAVNIIESVLQLRVFAHQFLKNLILSVQLGGQFPSEPVLPPALLNMRS